MTFCPRPLHFFAPSAICHSLYTPLPILRPMHVARAYGILIPWISFSFNAFIAFTSTYGRYSDSPSFYIWSSSRFNIALCVCSFSSFLIFSRSMCKKETKNHCGVRGQSFSSVCSLNWNRIPMSKKQYKSLTTSKWCPSNKVIDYFVKALFGWWLIPEFLKPFELWKYANSILGRSLHRESGLWISKVDMSDTEWMRLMYYKCQWEIQI